MIRWAYVAAPVLLAAATARADFPATYDLRDLGWVTAVRDQANCGSCWCFGTMASIESTLLKQGNWRQGGEPDLSENHLNWHHGFDPIPPCMGGDYRMTSAYFSRGSGPVLEADAPYEYDTEPPEVLPVHYYVRDIEWYDTIDEIKTAVTAYGAVSTCVSCWSKGTGGGWLNDAWYTAPDGDQANHSIAIVGWDDNWQTKAPSNGAWTCKNSWDSDWSGDGYFGIAYEDRNAGHDPEMGAVSFHNVVEALHKTIHYHDYHGWCAEKDYGHAFNAFTTSQREKLSAVSFYTTADGVGYEVEVYSSFANGLLGDLLAAVSGTCEFRGFHTVDLLGAVPLAAGDEFYICVRLDNAQHAIDCTVEKDVLMGDGAKGYTVVSVANPGESFYSADGAAWADLYYEHYDSSANFCIKGLTTELLPGDANLDDGVDIADLGVVASYYGQSGMTWRRGDFNVDGTVNVADLGVLATYYGQSLGASQVPEPATILLLALGGAALAWRRRGGKWALPPGRQWW